MRAAALSISLAFLLGATSALANTHRVPSDYASIQAGIDACAEGDTVLVAPGSYTGGGNANLTLGNLNLVVIGEDGPEVTFLDGEVHNSGFLINGGQDRSTVIAGFTFHHCIADFPGGGAIRCLGVSPTLRDLVIEDCSAQSFGGGFYCEGGAPRVESTKFLRNRAIYWGDLGWALGGAIYTENADLEVVDCLFIRNIASQVLGWECCSAAKGGAIYAVGTGTLSVAYSAFAGNTVDADGNGSEDGATIWTEVPTILERSTIYGSPFGGYSPEAVRATSSLAILQSVFACNAQSIVSAQAPAISFSIFYGNGDDGNWGSYETVLVADPLLCDPLNGDFCVSDRSPCLPANNPWSSAIGEAGIACTGPQPIVNPAATWGRLDGIALTWGWGGSDQLGIAIYREGSLIYSGTDPNQVDWFDADCAPGAWHYALRALFPEGLGPSAYADGWRKRESLTIEEPDGGEQFNLGADLAIIWTSEQLSSQVRIELSRSGSEGPWEVLAESTEDDGAFVWVVEGPFSANCFIRLSDPLDALPSAVTAAPFKIGARKLMVPEEYALIAAALVESEQGDTISLAPGVYLEHDLELKAGTILSGRTGVAGDCVIDAAQLGRVLTAVGPYLSGTKVSNLTLRGGLGQYGGAVRLQRYVTFENCVFRDNHASWGGAVYTSMAGPFVGCLFESNEALYAGGAVYGTQLYSSFGIFGCTFTGNSSTGHGGALAFDDVRGLAVKESEFYENVSASEGGAAYCYACVGYFETSLFRGNSAHSGGALSIREYGGPSLRDCTLVENESSGANQAAGVAYAVGTWAPRIDRCLIAFNRGGPSLRVQGGTLGPVLHAVDIFGNEGGNWIPAIVDQLGADCNMEADPLFCSTGELEYRLDPNSPCLPANNSCGVLIGAFGLGCDEIPVVLNSFTALPSAGAVDLAWEAAGPTDFRLTGTRETASWEVPWQAADPGHYRARDESPQLAPGGRVSYSLEGREPQEDWQLLRVLGVELSPAFATRFLTPHPNPFNPTVTLPFTLAAPGRVRLEVFDLAGRRIATLADGRFEVGEQILSWDGRNTTGTPQASGVYFVRFAAPGHTDTKRLVLLR